MSKQHIIDMTGKVVLITGGSRGLGRAMALGFAEAGADIVVASRHVEACEEVASDVEKLGRKAMAHACHVGRWRECDALAEAVYARFGKVDVLSTTQANLLSTIDPSISTRSSTTPFWT
jgi:NAD(P)-dependent dehydrogenase (short-subunit alcohol dehydrogenase family)